MQKSKSTQKFISIVLAVMLVLSTVVIGVNATSNVKVAFTNNKGWSRVYVYAWDSNDNPIMGDWPGTRITNSAQNDMGEPVFYTEIPSNTNGLVFCESADGQQTVDIDFNGHPTGWYMTNKNGNTWQVATWNYNPDSQTQTDPPSGSKTVYFTNTQGWSNIKAHAWDSNQNALLGSWPGASMTWDSKNSQNQDIYKIILPESAIGVVFSNNGGAQTVDLVPVDNTGFYPQSQNNQGKWNCGSWSPVKQIATTAQPTTVQPTTAEPTEAPTTVEPTTEDSTMAPGTYKTVYFKNTERWENIYAYGCDNNNQPVMGSWPGKAMMYKYTAENSIFVYSVEVPSSAKYVCFTNNDGEETVEILPRQRIGFYPVSKDENSGKWTTDLFFDYEHQSQNEPTTQETPPENSKAIYFADVNEWENFYAPYKKVSGESYYDNFEDTKMTYAYTEGNGVKVFRIYVPEDAVNLSFETTGSDGMVYFTPNVAPIDQMRYYPKASLTDYRWALGTYSPGETFNPFVLLEKTTVYFKDTIGFDNIKYFYFNLDLSWMPTTGYDEFTYLYNDRNGNKIYKAEFPADTDNFVFNFYKGDSLIETGPNAPINNAIYSIIEGNNPLYMLEADRLNDESAEYRYTNSTFRPTSYSLSLKESIAINFRVKPETVEGFSDIYLSVNYLGNEEILRDYTTLSDGTLVFQFDKIVPQAVGEDATAVLYGKKDGVIYYGEEYSRSVLKYADKYQVSGSNSLKGLLVNLLRYCAEAQKISNYNTDKLVSKHIVASAAQYAKNTLDPMEDVKDFHAEACPNTATFEFNNAALVLGNCVGIKVKFTAEDISDKSIRVDYNGESKYFEAESLTVEGNSNGRGIFVYDLYANQLNDTVKFTVCQGENHTPISDTMTYSAASYIRNYIDSEIYGPLLTELMLYGQAASYYTYNP